MNWNAPGLALTGTVAAWSQTVPDASNYSELMTLACKNALLAPGDEVQTLAAREGRPGGPEGRIGPSAIAPPAGDGPKC